MYHTHNDTSFTYYVHKFDVGHQYVLNTCFVNSVDSVLPGGAHFLACYKCYHGNTCPVITVTMVTLTQQYDVYSMTRRGNALPFLLLLYVLLVNANHESF